MIKTAVLCRVCGAETDAFLCSPCTAEVEKALAEVPAQLADLDVTISRQDRGVGNPLYAEHPRLIAIPGVHYAEGTTTLPQTGWAFAWDAANLAWSIQNTLQTWCRHLFEARRFEIPSGPACRNCTHRTCQLIRARGNAQALLLLNLDAIRTDEAAAAIHDELTSHAESVEHAVDRHDPDIYAGRCDGPDVRVTVADGVLSPVAGICGLEMFARFGDEKVKCRACGAVYDVADRKERMLAQIDDVWARAHDIANALTSLAEPVKPETLRQWIARDKERAGKGRPQPYPVVRQVGIDDDGHALYRVGDVRARIAAMKAARSDRVSA